MGKDDPKMTKAQAKTIKDFVNGYYGDDSYDYSKLQKIRHVNHMAQFATAVYVVSTNSKLAHTDFFRGEYTTVDSMYAKAAELVIRLLHAKYKDGKRDLTIDDFKACGGEELFKGRSPEEFAAICNDYIKEGGLVDSIQANLPEYEQDEANASVYGEIVSDMSATKADHNRLLRKLPNLKGSLTPEQIFELYDTVQDAATGMWKGIKDDKSGADKKLAEQMEEAFYLKYDLVKKSLKVAGLATGVVTTMGALAGGLVFVPISVGLCTYALGKKWIPDWFESLGKSWGGFEKRLKTKRDRDRAKAKMAWIVSYGETGGKPKIPFKYKKLLSAEDLVMLKKQAKVLPEFTFEKTNGEIHEGRTIKAAKALENLGEYQQKDSLVAVDDIDSIKKLLDGITPENATSDDFTLVASAIKSSTKLTVDEALKLKSLYAEKLKSCAKKLIFQTDFETGTDFQDKINKFYSDSFVILDILKDSRPDVVEVVKRYTTFASKELTGLGGKYIGGPLEKYIEREPTEKMDLDGTLVLTENGVAQYNLSAYAGTAYAGNIENVLQRIANLKIKANKDEEFGFVVDGTNPPVLVSAIAKEIAGIQAPAGTTNPAESKAAADARDLCNQALNKQMIMLSGAKSRRDSRAVYEAILGKETITVTGESRILAEFGGKLNLSDLFAKFNDVKYDTIDTFSRFYDDMGKMEPAAVRDYIRGKFSKQVYDEMKAYAGTNRRKFEKDLKALSEYLKNVNGCRYLNEQQKMELSSSVSGLVESAFGNCLTNLYDRFVDEYDTDFFANCLKGYQNGGFAELFASDQSVETQNLKYSFEYMRDMQDVYKTLKFNDQFDLNKDEAKYIAKTLLTDRTTGEPPELKTRIKSTDPLVQFIDSNIKNMSLSFTGTIDPTDENLFKKQQPYQDLTQALAFIDGMPEGNEYEKYDKYTALLILKNKCISLFRLCMKNYIETNGKGYPAEWINNHRTLVDNLKDIWQNDIMKKIQTKITEMSGKVADQCATGGNITAETAKYGTANETVAAYGAKQL